MLRCKQYERVTIINVIAHVQTLGHVVDVAPVPAIQSSACAAAGGVGRLFRK